MPRAGGAAAWPRLVAAWEPPVDPQRVQDQDAMTWNDYRPVPGANWSDTARQGSRRQIRVALLVADFDDQPFVITLPQGSDRFGNPRAAPVAREEVPRFYRDFYAVPSPRNHGRTVHEYWMEQSHGRVGVSIEAFGPYRLQDKSFQYGLDDADMPGGYRASKRSVVRELDSLWIAEHGERVPRDFDVVVRMVAGYDEAALWQPFGAMRFGTRDAVPPEWGNPDPARPRWVPTRYGGWTVWQAARWVWSDERIVQGEAINTMRHEIAHAVFRLADTYNNPLADPPERAAVGPWDLMDRGAFNGPGGPYTRWHVPPNAGGAVPAGLLLRHRLELGFVDSSQVLWLSPELLAREGLFVARVSARASPPLPGTFAGIHIRGSNADADDYTTVEVVQRAGSDSFTPDDGVLIVRHRARSGSVEARVVDANPADIAMLDYVAPDGARVMRSAADYRQLNDALFRAGVNSGSTFEWRDSVNRVDVYVLQRELVTPGVLVYTVAVRSLAGSGPHVRGVALRPMESPVQLGPGGEGLLEVRLVNTGSPRSTMLTPFPGVRAHPLAMSDVYRLAVRVDGAGWEAGLLTEAVAVPFGESRTVRIPVRFPRDGAAAASRLATVTVRAISESDVRAVESIEVLVNRN